MSQSQKAKKSLFGFMTRTKTATRAHHDQKFNHIQASGNTYLYSFLPRTIPQWNSLCISNLTSIDLETFKQLTVSKS